MPVRPYRLVNYDPKGPFLFYDSYDTDGQWESFPGGFICKEWAFQFFFYDQL